MKRCACCQNNMRVEEIKDRAAWEAFVSAQPHASFPQSWAWGNLQSSLGHEARRFFVIEGERVVAACQTIYFARRFSGYWFAPRGPIFTETDPKRARKILTVLSETFYEKLPRRSVLFYRFEPILQARDARGAFPLRFCRQLARNPVVTVISDLQKMEEESLALMHEKTRYNIRVAAKHGVTARIGTQKDFAAFLLLMQETAARDSFLPHDEAYLRATYESLAPSGMARLRVAEHEGKILASSMEIAYGDMVTYLHGASSSEKRNVKAPYALHWEAMRAARAEGFRFYDWWGCNPDRVSHFSYKPSWEGITRFKLGWGGRRMEWAGTWDLPLNRVLYRFAYPQYWFRG